mgnify:CR=1 FL=1
MIEATPLPFDLPAVARKKLTVDFDGGNQSSDGGVLALRAAEQKVGIISIEVARPDFPVADRNTFADTDLRAAAKGFYLIRDFAPGPRHGYVISQGSSSTVNLVKQIPAIEKAGMADVRMGWWGESEVNRRHHYVIQGQTFIIEYNNTQNDANHVHSIFRSLEGDFAVPTAQNAAK